MSRIANDPPSNDVAALNRRIDALERQLQSIASQNLRLRSETQEAQERQTAKIGRASCRERV